MDALDALATTRAIRRYTDAPVTDDQLATILFAASRAPSGSNRQPFRFVVLRDGEVAATAKALVGDAAAQLWASKRIRDGYDEGSGVDPASPKARMAATMEHYVANLHRVPVLVLPCLVRYREPTPTEGASIYPACQNLLVAARAIGLGGVLTNWHAAAEPALRELLAIPDEAAISATITIGHPAGSHGPVRRRPLDELVFADRWGHAPDWAQDPPGTRHTSAGPRRREG